jgi:hypothetical protein
MTIQELYTRWTALRDEINGYSPEGEYDEEYIGALEKQLYAIEDQAVGMTPSTIQEMSLQLCMASADDDVRQVNTLMGVMLDRARACAA